MQTKSNKIGNVSWTVHTETGWDVVKARKIWAAVYNPALGEDDPEYDKWLAFVEVFVQSDSVVTPFKWPEFTTEIDQLRAVRDAWLALPAKVYRTWKNDISEVDKISTDDDLLPPDEVPKEDATIPPSLLNESNSEAE